MGNKKMKNPLVWVWNAFGTVGGVLSLSSMVTSWLGDLIAWRPFLTSLIRGYRSVVDPVFSMLFGWLPFTTPRWIGDYIVLGVVFGIALRQVAATDMADAFAAEKRWHVKVAAHAVLVLVAPIYALFHLPTILYTPISLFVYRFGEGRGQERNSGEEFYLRLYQWVGAIVLVAVVLLAAGAQYRGKPV